MPLTVSNIAFAPGTNATEWRFGAGFPTLPLVVSNAAGFNLTRVPVVFRRQNATGSAATVVVTSDAAEGTGVDSSTFVPDTKSALFSIGSCSGPDITVTDVVFQKLWLTVHLCKVRLLLPTTVVF